MKLLPSLKKSIRIATPVLIALLLSIAILPGAALAQGPSGTPGSSACAKWITRRIARRNARDAGRGPARDAGRGPARRRNVKRRRQGTRPTGGTVKRRRQGTQRQKTRQ